MLKRCAVLGNPIEHSLSPQIHQLFAKQTGINLQYDKICIPELEFKPKIRELLQQNYCGFNITLPFKERALECCHQLTARATRAGAVNTIAQVEPECILGDNTDGIGLLTDLQRLGLIQSHYHVLILGAGGASRGIIAPLIEYGCKIAIANRTLSKAQALSRDFSDLAIIPVSTFDELSLESIDLVINATSMSVVGSIPQLPDTIHYNKICCYDLYYSATLTPFLHWVIQRGCINYADGLGMLVAQAAHSFKLWHGVMPDVIPVIEKIQQQIGHYSLS